MRAQPDDGHSHAYFAHTDSALYMGMVRYHVDVSKLRYQYTNRDEDVWYDDHFSLGLKTGIHENLEYAFYVNALGTMSDGASGVPDAPGQAWNGDHEVATFIGTDHWSMELVLPFGSFNLPGVNKGDMWLLCSGWGETATSEGAAWIGSHGIPSNNLDGLAVFQ